MIASLRAEGLTRTYAGPDGPVPALEAADFVFHRREVVAIRGPSGGGKSTLLNLLGLLDRSTAGRLWLEDERVDRLQDRAFSDARRRHVGFLFQDAGLVEKMTTLDNVRLPLDYRPLSDSERRDKAGRAIKQVGLEHRRNALVDTLSGGERQRVGLARLLAVRPNVIICDEPTASLDEANSHAVVEHLRTAAADGACVVCASHDPIMLDGADRLLTLTRGRLAVDGR